MLFEKRVLRKIFWPKRLKIKGKWIKSLMWSFFICLRTKSVFFCVIKSKKVRWTWYMPSMVEKMCMVGKEKGPLGKPKRRWGVVLRRCEGVERIFLA
jgi:hypothetical protein